MALKVGISSYVSAGFTNPVRWDLVESVSGVKIDEHNEAGPHGLVYTFDWTNNIRDIVYRVEFYDVPGGIGLGNLVKAHDVTPSTSTAGGAGDADIELLVGGPNPEDPIADSTSVTIPGLIGKTISLEQRAYGTLRQVRDVEITFNDVTGEIALVGGNTFTDQDTYFVHVKPTYVTNPPGTQPASGMYNDVILVTADRTVDSTDFGKLLIVDGIAAVITLELDAIASFAEKVPLFIESVGVTHTAVIIQASGSETIRGLSQDSNTFILGKAQTVKLIVLGGVLYAFTDDADARRVGRLEWTHLVGINRLACDGTEYVGTAQPRLFKEIPNIGAVSYAVWGSTTVDINLQVVYPFKGMYAISDDGLSFKVPDLRDKFVRALADLTGVSNPERLTPGVGGLQEDRVRPHTHTYLHPTARWGSANNGDNKNFNSTVAQSSTASGSYGQTETNPVNIGLIPTIIS